MELNLNILISSVNKMYDNIGDLKHSITNIILMHYNNADKNKSLPFLAYYWWHPVHLEVQIP